MLDIHKLWFIVLLVNFLVLTYVLNILLFRPILKIFKERDDLVSGSLDAAKEMNEKKDEAVARMNRELADARSQAKEAFDQLRNEGVLRQKDVLAAAEHEAAGLLQKARQELQAEAGRARQAMQADIDRFSDEIVRKLVKA